MLVAFSGYKGSGKDTCADYLVNNYDFIKVAFADPLKKILKTLFMFTDEQLYGKDKEIGDNRWFGCSPRTAMQYVGTQLIRNQLDVIMPGLGQDYFVYYFKLWYEQQVALNPDVKIVLSDLRNFSNEIEIIKHFNGVIINIDRPGLDKIDTHESEQPIKDYKYCIGNNGTLRELYVILDDLMLTII